MKYYRDRNDVGVVKALKEGGIGVLKSDTLYGLMASATNQAAVERVYKARERSEHKASIILISDESQILGSVPEYAKKVLQENWPGPTSIILPADETVPQWLHRGQHSLAYRVPADAELRKLLTSTGPLIAPSANMQGEPPARSIAEAERYFGDRVDFYVDSGEYDAATQPSRVLRVLEDGTVQRLR